MADVTCQFRSVLGEGLLKNAEALIIVPPFAGLDRPSLGSHVLQACARARGHDVRVLYGSLWFASLLGEMEYEAVCYAPSSDLLGERVFSGLAYGTPSEPSASPTSGHHVRASRNVNAPTDDVSLARAQELAKPWVEALVHDVARHEFLAIGCTTTFEQTSASVAILSGLKALLPETRLIIGGANCEGQMAEGILGLSPVIDHVFAGECEETFPAFLESCKSGLPTHGPSIVRGKPCSALDKLPTVDFSDYYRQLDHFLPTSTLKESGNIWLPYESSRGCWWGEKQHCTFCGINGEGMPFREKSADRVVVELSQLLASHPTRKICMVDNIMPHRYFTTLLPRMEHEVPDVHIFYEQKANLSLEKVSALKRAGIAVIQPGIEALNSSLLRLMRKGVTATQNLTLLRYCCSVDLSVNWNLLYAFPGDRQEWYDETLQMLPLIAHLNPPTGVFHLSIDRFSPYFDDAASFGVTNIRPIAAYLEVLPSTASAQKIAYHFSADYRSESREARETIAALRRVADAWRDRWSDDTIPAPVLSISRLQDDAFIVIDTRGLPGGLELELVDGEQARAALVGCRRGIVSAAITWALERKHCLAIDGGVVPLAVAEPALLREMESEARSLGAAEKPPVELRA